MKVKYGNRSSGYKWTELGLPKGTISSLTLFNIYINNFPKLTKTIKDTNISMFADDVIISIKTTTKPTNISSH